ncbi:hypothetical protein [Arthrobacter sp. VKM Ac-2550]|nr:hypothetical protein [Arthrobacter sp. VKM Ac-2550]
MTIAPVPPEPIRVIVESPGGPRVWEIIGTLSPFAVMVAAAIAGYFACET